jgi:hypothetical protein
MRRDVRRDEGAEGCREGEAAAEAEALVALGILGGVAGGTAAGPEQALAAGGIAFGQRGAGFRRQALGSGQEPEEPEGDEARDGEGEKDARQAGQDQSSGSR